MGRLPVATTTCAGVEPFRDTSLALRAPRRASCDRSAAAAVDAGLPLGGVLTVAALADRSPAGFTPCDAAALAASDAGRGVGLGPAGGAAAVRAHLAVQRHLALTGDTASWLDEPGQPFSQLFEEPQSAWRTIRTSRGQRLGLGLEVGHQGTTGGRTDLEAGDDPRQVRSIRRARGQGREDEVDDPYGDVVPVAGFSVWRCGGVSPRLSRR